MTESKRARVVIVGAGFGGLSAARALAGSGLDVLVIDRNNFHTFLPLLYQVASAELEPGDISYPVRSILRRMRDVRFVMSDVRAIDFASRTVATPDASFSYDYLVLAAGSSSRFYGVPGAAEHAFELKTMDQALALRNHILCCLEQAAGEEDPERRKQLLTFVIIGGGPTGVEFAGALSELVRGPVRKDYPMLDIGEVGITLLQAVDAILPEMGRPLGDYAVRRLAWMGVNVRLGATADSVGPEGVTVKGKEPIAAKTVVWTAGVRGDRLAEVCGLTAAGDGRVRVLPTLQATGHPEVYVVGDLAYVEAGGHPLPFVAPVAVQEGKTAALNIRRQVAGESPLPFQYRDRGSMATIGRMSAVARIGRSEFTGFGAWILWLGVHIFNLIGFRNRLTVMVNWAWDFLFFERAARLILPSGACSGLRTRETKEGNDRPQS